MGGAGATSLTRRPQPRPRQSGQTAFVDPGATGHVDFVAELPRTSVGKIVKHLLG
jgi:hypothetical protein